MIPHRSLRISARHSCRFLALLLSAVPVRSDDDRAVVQTLLQHPIVGPDLALAEVQAYTERRVPRMPDVKSVKQWNALADKTRRDVLDKVVFRGEAANWRKEKTKVVWLETMEGGPGYRIRKLRYEAVPGFWIPAILYEPEILLRNAKAPVALNVNGHEGIGKSVPYKQARCINQVKRGMIVLNPEWIGMGQLNSTNYQHYRMNQLDLCGTSGLAPFYLAMSRGLDVLLDHPNADPARVMVSGLSGGGWQTIFLSSLDPRVTLCNPVAGYSSFRTRARYFSDLGDSEQTPCDLATIADYTHLTAMLAPRPALLTYNFKDNCCFASPHALEPLLTAAATVYRLQGQPSHLRSHVNYEPGDHNFGPDNRQAHYRMLGDFFFPEVTAFNATEIPCEDEIEAHTNLLVELPSDNENLNSLARLLMTDLPREADLPTKKSRGERWQETQRDKLRGIVRAKNWEVVAAKTNSLSTNGISAVFWRLKVSAEWTVPAVELVRGETTGTALLVGDSGRDHLGEEAHKLVSSGRRVLAVDPFYFGESKVRTHDYLFALLIASVGERPLGIQASQLAAIARWAKQQYSPDVLEVVAIGPRASTIALVAAALEFQAIDSLELSHPLGSLKQVIEDNIGVNQRPELFCFGLLEFFDIRQLGALAAPRPLVIRKASARAREEFGALNNWYRTLEAPYNVVPEP